MTVSCACPCRACGLSQRQRRCLLCSSNACHWRCLVVKRSNVFRAATPSSAHFAGSPEVHVGFCAHTRINVLFLFLLLLQVGRHRSAAAAATSYRTRSASRPSLHCPPSIFSVDLSYGNPPWHLQPEGKNVRHLRFPSSLRVLRRMAAIWCD